MGTPSIVCSDPAGQGRQALLVRAEQTGIRPLALDRPDALSNAIHASFSYVDGGVAGSANLFTTTPTIFNSVNFTRAGFDAATPVPLPAAVWLLGSGLIGVVAIGRKRRVA